MNAKYTACRSGKRVGRQSGLTILELLISLGLGLVLLMGMGTIYLGSKQTYRMQESSARIQETGRYTLEIIGRSIRQAGYSDLSASLTKTGFGGTPITGTNGSGSAPDTITVQYDWMNGDSTCDSDTAGSAGFIVQDSFSLDTTTFQLRCDGVIAASPGAPGAGLPIVDGVEDFQVMYGIDNDGDQSANFYTATPGTWGQVVSARVCVLIRSANQGLADTAQHYLSCASALAGSTSLSTATDRRLRRVFVATFNLRNRVSIRP